MPWISASDDSIPPFLQIHFVQCMDLLQRAYNLKLLPLQTIHVVRAIHHVVISLAKALDGGLDEENSSVPNDTAEKENLVDLLRVAPIIAGKLQSLLYTLGEILKALEGSSVDLGEITADISRILNDLCGDYPGAVVVRQSFENFQRLILMDRDGILPFIGEEKKPRPMISGPAESGHGNPRGGVHAISDLRWNPRYDERDNTSRRTVEGILFEQKKATPNPPSTQRLLPFADINDQIRNQISSKVAGQYQLSSSPGDISSIQISVKPPPLFALIIGINEYASDEFDNLDGAVADAQEVKAYLERSLGVPASQIKTFFNTEATRNAIIASLRDLKQDTDIKYGDPILIYYAGHGSTAEAPAGWVEAGHSEIQILVPHDALCESDGITTHGIPDRTIGVLLEQIAQEKDNNITVIFDCCHSGSMTRNAEDDRSNAPRVRGARMPVKIPAGLDKDIWGGNRGMATAPGFQKSGLLSHVLLSACGAEEKAKEFQGRGYFTKSLLDTLEAVGADKVTYAELIQRLPCQPAQNPQCEGVGRDRICFNSKVRERSSHMYRVIEKDQQYIVNVGTIHGITDGAIFGLYNDPNLKSSQTPVATFKASKPEPFTTKLVPFPQGAQFEISDGAFALLLHAGEQEAIRIHVDLDERLMSVFMALASDVPVVDPAQPKFMLVKEKKGAELDIAVDGDHIVFNIADPLVTAHGLNRMPFTIQPNPNIITPIIRRAARYFWHLRRTGSTKALQSKVGLELTTLEEVNEEYDDDFNPLRKPCGPNLIKDGVIDIVIDPRAIYGIKLTNKWDKPLYTSLFYFDNSDLSITSYYQPAAAAGKVDPPLRRNGSITLGYGSGGGAPFDYSLREGQDVDVGFLKLFVSTDPVDLSCIPQTSPFEETNRAMAAARSMEERPMPTGHWSTLLITVVQRRGKT